VQNGNLASGEIPSQTRGRVFVLRSQPRDSHQEITWVYDGCASGVDVYAYVEGDPVSFIDPEGLLPKKWVKPNNPNKHPAPPHRIPGEKRERNVKHPDGEEHSVKPKGPRSPPGRRGAGFVDPSIFDWFFPWWAYSPDAGGCDDNGNCSDTVPNPDSCPPR
jgi:hypothetical protein